MNKVVGLPTLLKERLVTEGTFPWKGVLLIFLCALACFLVWIKFKGTYESTDNLRDIVSGRYATAQGIVDGEALRYGLQKYLDPCDRAEGTEATECRKDDLANSPNDTTTALSNFYFSTVNMTGCFFPTESSSANPRDLEYVFSKDAVAFAVAGGARAFVLEIWPSMHPQGRFQPVLQVVEEGTSWRRVSMNTLSFSVALETILTNIYAGRIQNANKDTRNDLAILYLRFRGSPRTETYKGVAEAIAKFANPYLLDPSFSSCRNPGLLIKTPLGELQGKVVFLANRMKGELETLAPTLLPYINMCAPTPSSTDSTAALMKIEYSVADLANISTDDSTRIRYISSMITFVIPSPEEARTNQWNWGIAKDRGVHCIPMNFFERKYGAQYFELFRRYSYRLKPMHAPPAEQTAQQQTQTQGFQNQQGAPLRLPIIVIPEAPLAQNPGTGTGEISIKTQLTDGDTCRPLLEKANSHYLELRRTLEIQINSIKNTPDYFNRNIIWKQCLSTINIYVNDRDVNTDSMLNCMGIYIKSKSRNVSYDGIIFFYELFLPEEKQTDPVAKQFTSLKKDFKLKK